MLQILISNLNLNGRVNSCYIHRTHAYHFPVLNNDVLLDQIPSYNFYVFSFLSCHEFGQNCFHTNLQFHKKSTKRIYLAYDLISCNHMALIFWVECCWTFFHSGLWDCRVCGLRSYPAEQRSTNRRATPVGNVKLEIGLISMVQPTVTVWKMWSQCFMLLLRRNAENLSFLSRL